MDRIKRFLIIRLDEIGDYVLTAPLLRELKRNFPEAEIDLIVKPSLIGFVSGSPYVSCVWGAEVKRRKLLRNWRLFLILLLRRMRCGRYGIAILPRPERKRFLHIPHRLPVRINGFRPPCFKRKMSIM